MSVKQQEAQEVEVANTQCRLAKEITLTEAAAAIPTTLPTMNQAYLPLGTIIPIPTTQNCLEDGNGFQEARFSCL